YSAALPQWALELRKILNAAGKFQFPSGAVSTIHRFCEIGSGYAFQHLNTRVAPRLMSFLSPQAKRRLKAQLREALAEISKPCLELQINAWNSAIQAVRCNAKDVRSNAVEHDFFDRDVSYRLSLLFKEFPCLARLWCELILQWRDRLSEFLLRFDQDRVA